MLKQTVLDLMRVTGAFAPFRVANRSKVLILTYHRFSAAEADHKTSAQAFADHLQYLTEHYRILPLGQIADCIATGKTLPQGVAALTIDDGYQDFYDVAYPLLLKHRVPATLFVATDFVDRKCWLWTDKMRYLTAHTAAAELDVTINERSVKAAFTTARSRHKAANRVNALLKTLPNEQKEEALKQMATTLGVLLPAAPPAEYGAITWQQAREMDNEGIEVASHTVTHPILPNTTNEQLRYEMTASRARLEEELGHQVSLFCYPNGRQDARVQQATAQAGYRCAVTNQHGMNTLGTPLLGLQRVAPEPDLSHFVQSTSGFEEIKSVLRNGWYRRLAAPTTTAATVPQLFTETINQA
ncbi:MAG: polysaccharide deacetylase family protein [Acidobacteria bacterium]|nr:polysaccharide deacetylase family protein [Acidobacteriota bacterium]